MVKKKNRKKKFFRKHPFELFLEVVVLIALIPFFYGLSIFAFYGYCFTVLGVFFSGEIFRRKKVMRFVVFGSILTYVAGLILIYGFKQNDLITFILVILVAVFVWIKGYRLKKFKR